MPTRRQAIATLASAIAWPRSAWPQSVDLYKLQRDLIDGTPQDFFAAIDAIQARGQPDMAAGLITSMRLTSGPTAEISHVLSQITGETTAQTWFDWMLWQERHPEIAPHPSFIDFKRDLFLAIDPNFDVFLRSEHLQPDAMRIRLEEVTWGGVRKDGIPSLDFPELIDASDADYMQENDLVFGVSINGDVRAYPLRIMGWHEMFNDIIGGVPVALAYCTLCGSGILFETTLPDRNEPLVFGSSGFLYRSNKLMFDRATHSLWNQFTGRPVSGPLVNANIKLAQRPVVIDTWANWRITNPTTKILSLNTGHTRDYGSGVVYTDYFASDDLMFPAEVDQSKLRQKEYVFGIRQFGGAKAWPLKAFSQRSVINDTLLGQSLVLIGDPHTRTVRAFERGAHNFSGGISDLQSDGGLSWKVTENALISTDGRRLARVAGHIAYWFAWDSYLGANSEFYDG
jgi:hypothetical protein